jgi:hypothetical protein
MSNVMDINQHESENKPTTFNPALQDHRWKAVKECIAKGDKAAAKAEDFYITAGQHLKALKAEHTGTWAEWEELLKTKIGIGKSRASELMLIADGTKTAAEIASASTERSKKHRALSPLRNGENAADPETSAKPIRAPAEQPDQTVEPLEKKAPKIAIDPKRDIVRETFDLVLRMSREQRAEFFDLYLQRYGDQKYRGKFREAWREAKAAPQPKNKPKAPGTDAVAAAHPVENAPPPDAGADNMRARIAALDDGLDIPECLRRRAP